MKLRRFEVLICSIVQHFGTATPKKCCVISLYNVLKAKYFHHENFCTVVPSTGPSCAPSYASIYRTCIIKRSEYRFSYIGSLSSVILATLMLSHYVVTVGSTVQSLSSPYPSYTITTQTLDFIIGIRHRKFPMFLT
jgi:hypothetical protein